MPTSEECSEALVAQRAALILQERQTVALERLVSLLDELINHDLAMYVAQLSSSGGR